MFEYISVDFNGYFCAYTYNCEEINLLCAIKKYSNAYFIKKNIEIRPFILVIVEIVCV